MGSNVLFLLPKANPENGLNGIIFRVLSFEVGLLMFCPHQWRTVEMDHGAKLNKYLLHQEVTSRLGRLQHCYYICSFSKYKSIEQKALSGICIT